MVIFRLTVLICSSLRRPRFIHPVNILPPELERICCACLSQKLRPTCVHKPLQQQLWSLSFPGEAHPADDWADEPLPVYGEGINVRDWIYVEDHYKAIDLIIHKGRVGEVYNVGGHNEMRNIYIIKSICKEFGKTEGGLPT